MDYINEMNNLVESINVKEYEGQPVVSSREIADNFKKEHKTVLRSIENIKAQNCAVTKMFFEDTYKAGTGKEYKEYLLTRDGFSLLVMGFTGAKALKWKLKYIEAFNKMEQYIKEQQPKVPTTYKEALEHLLVQVEENERLSLENKQQTKVIEKQSEVIGEMAPKADYFDALVDRKLLTSIRDTAKELKVKELKVKEKDFTAWLLQRSLCYRDKKRKIKPYASKMKYFELKEFTTIWGHSDTQTLITPKGRETFRLLLIKDGLIKDDNRQLELESLLKENEVVSDFYS